MSQHTSLSKMSRKRKFVYKQEPVEQSQDVAFVQKPESTDSSSDSDESEEDLEKDLMVFDEEQAEIIRNVNKMGSGRWSASEYGGHGSMMAFPGSASRSMSPNDAKKRRT